jgi:flagellar FliJ protein
MKRFVFGLETLRRLRIQKRREAEIELGKISALCQRIVQSMQDTQNQIAAGPQTLEPEWMIQEQAYLARLKSNLEQMASELLDSRRLEANWRQTLSIAQQQEEIVENLREAQWKRWRKAMLKEEQKILDDLPKRRQKII